MSNNDDSGLWKLLLFLGIGYAIYLFVQKMMAAFERLLSGLVIIALAAAVILVLFWVYRHISDKQYGETKRLQEIEKLERERKLHTARLPRHMKEVANQYYYEKQNALYDLKPGSRFDAMLGKTKQILHTFRDKGKSE
jgi:hypothetical protein